MTVDITHIQAATSLKLKSLKDLVKLIASTMGDRVTGYIGYYSHDDKHIYFMFNTSLGYYDLRALPIIVWVEHDEKHNGGFLRYRTSPKEELIFSDDVNDPKYPVSIPIVEFEDMPKFLRIWEKK